MFLIYVAVYSGKLYIYISVGIISQQEYVYYYIIILVSFVAL